MAELLDVLIWLAHTNPPNDQVADRAAKNAYHMLFGYLSDGEVRRRLNLCPDCLLYDGDHEPDCENEDAQDD